MEKRQVRVLLKSEKCLIMQPEVVEQLGRSAALVLQQLHFFLSAPNQMGKTLEGRRWIYNSYKAWEACLKILSQSTIKRAFEKLKRAGIVLSNNLNDNASNRTLWYTIDYEKLASFLAPSQTPESSRLISLKSPLHEVKMIPSSAQNDPILYPYSQITSHNQSLQSPSQERSKKLIQEGEEHGPASPLQILLSIWNEATGQTCELTVKRASYLMAAFKSRFGCCVAQWKAYCQRVASSAFLMGKVKSTFRASLDWVLKFDTITRIMEGDFGVQDGGERALGVEEQAKQEAHQGAALRQAMETSSETAEVKGIRLRLLEVFGAATYHSWFEKAQLKLMGEGRVVLWSPTAFGADYIQNHFGGKLEDLLGARVIYDVAV
jgi:DnaA N-terminal domain